VKRAVREFQRVWKWAWVKAHPVRFGGILFHLLVRTLFAAFWLLGGINKLENDWMTSDYLREVFLHR